MSKEAMKMALEALDGLIAITMAKTDLRHKAIAALKEALAEQPAPVHEPIYQPECAFGYSECQALEIALKKRTWVGLTDEWIESAGARWVRDGHDLYGFARAADAKLKEENT